MPFYNASQAARELDVPDKTIRRWLKQGLSGRWKLTAQRTASGQLLISEADIERIKRGREQDRAQFDRNSSPVKSEVVLSSQDLADVSRQVADLAAKIVQLEERIAVLESVPQKPPSRDEIPLVMPSLQPTTPTAIPKSQPQIRASVSNSNMPTELPAGSLSARDFAFQLGIKYTVFEGIIRHGIKNEQLERVEIPTAREGYSQKYFTPDQQAAAMLVLRKHGKLPDRESMK